MRRCSSMRPLNGLGAAVVGPLGGEVAQVGVLPLPQGLAQAGDLGDRAGRERGQDLLGDLLPGGQVGRGVGGADLLVALPCDQDLAVGIAAAQAVDEPVPLPVAQVVRAGAHHLSDRQWDRLVDGLGRGDPDSEVLVAWQCYQQVRSAYATPDLAAGKKIAEKILATFSSCPITEIARLGKTLRQWKNTYLGYFTTERSNNGGTEAIQRPHRTAPPHRTRLPKPRELQAPDAPGRRRTRPPPPTECPMSPESRPVDPGSLGPAAHGRHTGCQRRPRMNHPGTHPSPRGQFSPSSTVAIGRCRWPGASMWPVSGGALRDRCYGTGSASSRRCSMWEGGE